MRKQEEKNMTGYEKGKYQEVKFSYFELQVIFAILENELKQMPDNAGYFYTKRNLQDVIRIVGDAVNKCNNGNL